MVANDKISTNVVILRLEWQVLVQIVQAANLLNFLATCD
jgi:hypothetical protein